MEEDEDGEHSSLAFRWGTVRTEAVVANDTDGFVLLRLRGLFDLRREEFPSPLSFIIDKTWLWWWYWYDVSVLLLSILSFESIPLRHMETCFLLVFDVDVCLLCSILCRSELASSIMASFCTHIEHVVRVVTLLVRTCTYRRTPPPSVVRGPGV